MRIIELPVRVSILTENEIEKYTELGLEIPDDANEGVLYVNPEQVTAFLPLDDSIDLELSSGRRINIYMSIEEFLKVLKDGE
ncbi:hypothetical protein [Schnuerera sp.]|uniref:hypothetical protein n=1 Tax=Schnuerera sp. TaxID=2794844 RepID=UPI002C41E626|nr:hypothetical protein [Schnuerera sp.]HSH37032.1 hypothetical protein [Schnuerera sp.]